MRIQPVIFSLAVMGALGAGSPLGAESFYVSPSGKDAGPGSLAQPFATLQRAQQAAHQTSHRQPGQPVNIFLRGGVYYLPETLVLTKEDSGSQKAPVLYQAYGQEQPVISGGARLALQWEAYRDGILKATVPADFTSDQLFVNGERQPMARYPNFDAKAQYFNGFAPDAFSPERARRWSDPKGGFIHAMHSSLWGDFHYVITGVDAAGKVAYEGGWQNNRRMGMHDKFRFVENIFEELDAPGEWFHDAKNHLLYFYPPAGLDLKQALIESVRLKHLVEFRGQEQAPVRFVTLKGLVFRHSARTFMDNKEPMLRSDWTTYRGGAIFLTGTEDCALQDCFVDQAGGNAIFVNDYNRRLSIRGCQIANAGANGVAFVGDPSAVRNPLFEYGQTQSFHDIDKTPGPKSGNYPSGCLVEDCLIYRTGRTEKQTAPVQIEMAQGITVRHCSLYDAPRAGINIGDGAWGGHLVEFCDVFDTVKETGDHGSFNSWGRDRYWNLKDIDLGKTTLGENRDLPRLDAATPNVLQNNRWRCDHGWDIDLDDGSSNYIIRNNLCLKGGLKNREGFYRVVENNIIVGNSFHPHVWYANSEDVFERNIIFTPYQPIQVGKPWGKSVDHNLLHQAGAAGASPATRLQADSGRDEHSLTGDALFENPGSGDYRVKAGSPTLALGFKNFPMDQFGVQKPSLKAIARTPELPGQEQGEKKAAAKRDTKVIEWLSAKVRNISGMGEMSAHGLPGETGILVLEIQPASALAAAGLQKEDVLLELDGKKIDTVTDLAARMAKVSPAGEFKLTIFRGQKPIPLLVRRLAKP